MTKPFEVRVDAETEATPEEVWEAIATGPGLDAWFMGSNEIEPREGGAARMTLPGFDLSSTVTVWDPPHRLVTETPHEDDGRFMAFEYLIEGREGSSTVLRFVHSGFLPDDEWEAEYEALKGGDPAYIQKLVEYLRYFKGRRAVPVSAYGPQVDAERAWSVFRAELGLGERISEGDPVHFETEGLPAMDGVVDTVSPEFLGVRTDDGMYRFIHGLGGTVVVGHHVYADVDQAETEKAWQAWVERAFA